MTWLFSAYFPPLFLSRTHVKKEQTPTPPEPRPAKKTKSTDPDYVRTTVYLPKRLHKQLKAAAADEEREMSEILEELVEQWLKKRVDSDA